MATQSNIVGVWTARTVYETIPDSAVTLVFKASGTGWLDVFNVHKWQTDSFQWAPTSTGWIVLSEFARLQSHIYKRKSIAVVSSFEIEHLPYEIREVIEASGERKTQLRIEWPTIDTRCFELSDTDAVAAEMPTR